MAILEFKPYKGLELYRATNVYGEQYYIGNGQGCGTFWFKTLKDAKKFIDHFIDRITQKSGHLGLIPESVCSKCQNRYSPAVDPDKYRKYPPHACKELKERLISEALRRRRR